MLITYLSNEWLTEAATLLAEVTIEPPIEGPALALETVVTTDGDPIRFVYVFDGAGVSLVRSVDDVPAGASVVRLTQPRDVAAAVAVGDRSAQDAFLATDIQLGGDVTRLIQLSGLLAQVGDALAPLRDKTTH